MMSVLGTISTAGGAVSLGLNFSPAGVFSQGLSARNEYLIRAMNATPYLKAQSLSVDAVLQAAEFFKK